MDLTGREIVMRKTAIARKILSLSLAFTMVLSFCAFDVQSAFAEDQPAPIQDMYEVDGVKYFKIDSNAFDSSAIQYLSDMMSTGSSKLQFPASLGSYLQYINLSMGDVWLFVGAGLFRSYERYDGTYFTRASAMERSIAQNRSQSVTANGSTATANRVLISNGRDIQNYYSLAEAEKAVYSDIFANASLQTSKGYFKDDAKTQNVFAGAAYATTQGQNNSRVGLAVYFSDFQVLPLLPEDTGTNYITTKTRDVSNDDNVVASNVRNLTASQVTASQTVSKSETDTLSSTVSGSKTYTYSKGVEVSYEHGFSNLNKVTGKVSVSASKAVQSGWSKSESESVTDTTSQSVSVTLPPYTNVMLKQTSTTQEWDTKYNCPVGVQFTATVVMYKNDGSVLTAYQFGADSREDLYSRAISNRTLRDKDGIDWNYLYNYQQLTIGAIERASTYVPMSSTGGAFTETLDTMETNIYSILPIYPLNKVKVRAPNVSYISDESYSYGSYNYLNTDMYVGDFSYTNYILLDGLNKFNVDYYGFSKDFGHWVVADKDGNEWTGADAPVVIEKDPVSKNTMYKAVKPGVCYIKFVINEDVYNTADRPTVYTKNADLYQTAAVRINVKDQPFKGTVSVSGSFRGIVGDRPRQLDADGLLSVEIFDDTGKELVKHYVWEQKELPSKGISVDGNLVTFTKAGTFHVRAVSGDIKSDWIEIKATNSADTTYNISLVNKNTGSGTVEISKTETAAGEVVTVTASPKGAYSPKVTIKSAETGAVYIEQLTLTGTENAFRGSFKMPNYPVTVTVEYTEAGEQENEQNAVLMAKLKSKGKKGLRLSWNKSENAQGYDVFFAECGKAKKYKKVKTLKGNKTLSWTNKKLKEKTAYKAYVKAWSMIDGKKIYIDKSPAVYAYTTAGKARYTTAKSVTVKKTKVTLNNGGSSKIKASVVRLDKSKKLMPTSYASKLRYLSSNRNVATVSKAGKIKAKMKGTCYVYAYAQNGVYTKIKIKVK